MMLKHVGIELSHKEAIELLNARPSGTSIEDFQRVYRKLTGKRLAPITIKGVKRAINRGVPVLAVDSVREDEDHFVVIYGYDDELFLVHDPTPVRILKLAMAPPKRTYEELREAAGDQFFAPRSS
jgi:ABC-type bacteriocin/lantibiotic exporter with double-glycine peptidase domain